MVWSPSMRFVGRVFLVVVILGSIGSSLAQTQTGVSPPAGEEIASLIKSRQYAKAAEKARALISSLDAAGNDNSLETAQALDLLVEASWRGNLTDAARREDGERGIRIREQLLGPDDKTVATSLHLLANLLQARADPEGARVLYERSLAIREKVFGPDSLEVVPSLNNLGNIFRKIGDLTASRVVLERALGIREKRLGPNDADLARSHASLGLTLRDLGQYQEAEQHFRRAVAIREVSQRDAWLTTSLNELASVLEKQGRYEEAAEALTRAMALQEEFGGPEDPDLALCMGNLAVIRMYLGDFAASRVLQERALRVYEKTPPPDAYARAHLQNNLGHLFLLSGDPMGAKPLLQEALELRRKLAPVELPELAQTLINFGHLDRYLGDIASARAHYEEAVAILEKTRGRQSVEYAEALENLGLAYAAGGLPAKAREAFTQSYDILRHVLGSSPQAVKALQFLAALAFDQGRINDAERDLKVVLANRERTLGPSNPYVAETLQVLARIAALKGERARALDLALRVESINRDFVRLTIPVLPERQALALVAARPASLDLALSLAAQSKQPEVAQRTWDAVMRSRGLVLDELIGRFAAMTGGTDERSARLVKELDAARARLLQIHLRQPQEKNPSENLRKLEQARLEKETAEHALADVSAAQRMALATESAGLDEVRTALPPDAALVGYAFYEDVLRSDAHAGQVRKGRGGRAPSRGSYLAFVLAPGRLVPEVIPLGPSGTIDGLVGSWRREATAPASSGIRPGAESRYVAAGKALRRAIWDPLRAKLGNARQVFIVQDGALQLVSFGTLPDESSRRYLVEREPRMHLLTTERDLLRTSRVQRGRGLLVLGAPEFSSNPVEKSRTVGEASGMDADQPSGASAVSNTASAENALDVSRLRNTLVRSGAGSSLMFEALPGTAKEAAKVRSAWKQSVAGTEEITVLEGPAATEAAFKTDAPGKRVLHVATHGFFLLSETSARVRDEYGAEVLRHWSERNLGPEPYESPLLLSGLVLAGANRRLGTTTYASTENDGLLLAEEIASLDLQGVDWAVLSACETGVGELIPREGIVGLRRAVLAAGVGTVIMSLWRVSDESAGDWIEALYRARFQQEMQSSEAAVAASRTVISSRRRSQASTHPFYWGAFVVAGDWK